MGKNKSEIKRTNITVQNKLDTLKNEELMLFHSYNRHAATDVKLEVLNRLIVVINQIDILKSLNS